MKRVLVAASAARQPSGLLVTVSAFGRTGCRGADLAPLHELVRPALDGARRMKGGVDAG
jgi:hypothetical protein